MTSRKSLNRGRLLAFLLAAPGFIAFAYGGLHASPAQPTGRDAMLCFGGFALFALGVLVGYFSGRCAHCRRGLGRLFSQTSGPLGITKDLRFCPYCGMSLDEPPQHDDA
jgi:hypothetical protein